MLLLSMFNRFKNDGLVVPTYTRKPDDAGSILLHSEGQRLSIEWMPILASAVVSC